jgi:hypothetical protein
MSWASFDNGKERLIKGSDWIRLLPHLLHRSTDLRVPSKIDLIASDKNDECEKQLCCKNEYASRLRHTLLRASQLRYN